MTQTVLYMARSPLEHRAVTLSVEPPGFTNLWLESADVAELRAKLAQADFLVTGSLTAEQLAWAPRLKFIQMPGVGYEHIDVAAANARGIAVAITPEGTIIGVAEHTIMLMLAIYKHLVEAHTSLRAGHWIHNQLRHICLMLEGKTIGIVGMGRIGREVAKRLRGFDVTVLYSDLQRRPPDEEAALNLRYVGLDELLSTADIVTLHVFLGGGSRHLIGARELALMKRSAVIINTSRGDVIDEAALLAALQGGHLLGAGLDVFAIEPTPPDNPLLALPNVLVTPHMATANRDAMIAKARACYTNFQRVLRGEPPLNVVRPYHEIEASVGRDR